jgi:hypothetical protein
MRETERGRRAEMFIYPMGLWVVFAIVGVSNGIFREGVLDGVFAERAATVLSTVILIAAILLLSWLYFARTSWKYTRADLLLIGLLWTILIVLFEFLALFAAGVPTGEMLAPYDVLAGEVWAFVPLTLLVAPLLFGHVLSSKRRANSNQGLQ